MQLTGVYNTQNEKKPLVILMLTLLILIFQKHLKHLIPFKN